MVTASDGRPETPASRSRPLRGPLRQGRNKRRDRHESQMSRGPRGGESGEDRVPESPGGSAFEATERAKIRRGGGFTIRAERQKAAIDCDLADDGF